MVMLTAPNFDAGSNPNSPLGQSPFFGRSDDSDSKTDQLRQIKTNSISRGSRKSKMILDIACLPEGVPLDLTTLSPRRGKPPPSPLNLSTRQV